MDNNDKNLNSETQENIVDTEQNSEEIEFDDNIDIDALQAKLQEHMELDDIVYEPEKTLDAPANTVEASQEVTSENSTDIQEFSEMLTTHVNSEEVQNDVVPTAESVMPIETEPQQPIVAVQPQVPQEKLKLQPGEKKFVIYIDPENLDFIESLSIKDRKKVINRVLHYEDENVRQKKERRERAKFTNQVIIMVVTVVISLPIFFMLLNKSIELTILNYQQAQQNFVKLYKEQGKIKSYKNFQKNFD